MLATCDIAVSNSTGQMLNDVNSVTEIDPEVTEEAEQRTEDDYATEFEYEHYSSSGSPPDESEYSNGYEEIETLEKLSFAPAETRHSDEFGSDEADSRHPRTCPELDTKWNCSHGNHLR